MYAMFHNYKSLNKQMRKPSEQILSKIISNCPNLIQKYAVFKRKTKTKKIYVLFY